MAILQTILVLLILAGLARLVLSHAPKALEALAAKLGAETEHNILAADERLNAQLIASVHGALLYARTHAEEVAVFYEHERGYVLSVIENDARFFHVEEERVLHAIEQVIHGTPLPEKPVVVPADGTSGGPGKGDVKPDDGTSGGPGSPPPTP